MKVGIVGVTAGSIALLLVLVHFWAGPFAPQQTLESSVAETAVAIRKAAMDALKGKEAEPEPEMRRVDWDADRIADVSAAVLGGLAIILGVVAFIRGEGRRVASGAAALGVSAIAFQFIAMYAFALLFVLLVVGTLSSLGLEDIGG